uniref:EGF-like domain-containing protein n=1 Tax=Panagrolaimus sp. ES5 TaxID=591445 RepID=A0AC34GEI0_9BILA
MITVNLGKLLLCETKISNACDTKVCKNGHCRLNGSIDKGICDCFYGFEGDKCERKTFCDPVSCSGHGICSSSNGTSTIKCLCDSGWKGERCETDINECENDPNLCAHGICINSPGSYFCRCLTGFFGVHCEKSSLSSESCPPQACQNGGT